MVAEDAGGITYKRTKGNFLVVCKVALFVFTNSLSEDHVFSRNLLRAVYSAAMSTAVSSLYLYLLYPGARLETL